MPWLAPFADAPDTHKIWADPGSEHERVLIAVKWHHAVPAPGSSAPDDDPVNTPAPPVAPDETETG